MNAQHVRGSDITAHVAFAWTHKRTDHSEFEKGCRAQSIQALLNVYSQTGSWDAVKSKQEIREEEVMEAKREEKWEIKGRERAIQIETETDKGGMKKDKS